MTTPAPNTPAPNTPAPNTPAPNTPAPQPAWHGLPETDTDGLNYIKNKGWAGPQDVIKSYQGAEKLIGRDPSTLISMPRADDPAGLLGVMDKLGRPADATKYEFSKPADGIGLDEGYQTWARGTFHEIGLTAAQVKTLTAKHNEYIKGVLDKQAQDYNLSVETDKRALLSEWKDGHERKMQAATSAAKSLGFTPEMMDAIEQVVGYAGAYKFFADLGQKMGEDSLGGGGNRGFDTGLTPAEAKAQWETLRVDANWKAAAGDPMHPNHAKAKKQQTDLFAIMYPA